jgi:membrane protease YdiL (CAAX protease family)
MSLALGHGPDTAGLPVQGESAVEVARRWWGHWDVVKAIVSVIVATLVAGAAAALVAGTLVAPGEAYEDDALAYALVLLPGAVAVEIFLLVAAIWFGPRSHGLSIAALGLRRPQRGSWWLAGAIAGAGLGVVYGYDALLRLTPVELGGTPDAVFDHPAPFIVVAVGAVLMAPWIEEIFFRGFVYGAVEERLGWLLAAIASSAVFAAAHLDVYGLPAYAAIGLLLAWAYHHTRSIRAGVIAHALINVVTVGVALATPGAI